MSQIDYQGSELEVFAHARNWKRYIRSQVDEYVHGTVLEVGAGMGSNALCYLDNNHERWVCLEPDPRLATCIEKNDTLKTCEVIVGTVADLPLSEQFDAILYMDVLEHIADDAAELRESAKRLRPNGRIVALSPAHSWLFTPFDTAIGHYRRYNAAMLRDLTPPGMELDLLRYLDVVGIGASLANRIFLSSASPTVDQVKTWDSILVPLSRRIDPLLAYKVGKSILSVWRARNSV